MIQLKYFIIAFAIIPIFATCKKDPNPDPNSFYFQCKVNGNLYIPSNCANCLQNELIGDTTFILQGNNGFTTLGTFLKDLGGIKEGQYSLNQMSGRVGNYKNSTLVNDRYFTDSAHTGLLTISLLDKTNKIIQGTFYYKAFNAYRNDSVMISDGKFRLKYLKY